MRYRKLDANGDYPFGAAGEFLVDSPEAVAQAVRTRLLLIAGEWFLDDQEGTPYHPSILGFGTQGTRDVVLKERILETPGVTGIAEFYSQLAADRSLTVRATVNTQFGTAQVQA